MKLYSLIFTILLLVLQSFQIFAQKKTEKEPTPTEIENHKRRQMEDSWRRATIKLVQENVKAKLQALGDYVFTDTTNLYQYAPKSVVLAFLNTGSKEEKLAAIQKVQTHKDKKYSIKFTVKNNKIYLRGIYFDVDDSNLGLEINLEKQIFLIDLNADGQREIIFYPNFDGGLEGQKLVIWAYDSEKKVYYFVNNFRADGIEQLGIDKNTNMTTLRYLVYGCCSDYSDKIYEYKIQQSNNKLSFKLQNIYAFSVPYYLFPKKLSTPKKVKLTYKSILCSKPILIDKKAPNGDYFIEYTKAFTNTYVIAEIPEGTIITELASYTNHKGEKWRFVVLEKGYKPEILINFELLKKDYQIYAWLPPENYEE